MKRQAFRPKEKKMRTGLQKNITAASKKHSTKHYSRSRVPIKSEGMKYKRRDNVGILLDENDSRYDFCYIIFCDSKA